jgi:8-oxo-dGTP diphosphatase
MLNTGPDAVPEIHVAVAVVWRGHKLLIARRPAHAHQGGLLEFPGGKVEADESVQQALVREVQEETGLVISEPGLTPLIGIRHDYGDKRVFLDVWQTATSIGEAEGKEGQAVGWHDPDELRDEDFPAANRAIIRALRLPSFYGVTGVFDSVSDGLCRLDRSLVAHRPALVVLRAPWLNGADYRSMAQEARAICDRHGSRLMLHGEGIDAGFTEGFAGWHLTWAQASRLQLRPVARDRWLAVSCHDEGQIGQAARLGADFVTLAPVQPTASHPGAPTLGWAGFGRLARDAAMPVYALGGLGLDDLDYAKECGAQGIAGIGNWW